MSDKNFSPKVVFACRAMNAKEKDTISFQRQASDSPFILVRIVDGKKEIAVAVMHEADLAAVAEKL